MTHIVHFVRGRFVPVRIDSLDSTGEVSVDGVVWLARRDVDTVVDSATLVYIMALTGEDARVNRFYQLRV